MGILCAELFVKKKGKFSTSNTYHLASFCCDEDGFLLKGGLVILPFSGIVKGC